MTVVGEIAAQALDYLIMDELAMSALSRGGWYGDVTEEMNDRQKEAFADKFYTVKMENGQIVAVAVEITEITSELRSSCSRVVSRNSSTF